MNLKKKAAAAGIVGVIVAMSAISVYAAGGSRIIGHRGGIAVEASASDAVEKPEGDLAPAVDENGKAIGEVNEGDLARPVDENGKAIGEVDESEPAPAVDENGKAIGEVNEGDAARPVDENGKAIGEVDNGQSGDEQAAPQEHENSADRSDNRGQDPQGARR